MMVRSNRGTLTGAAGMSLMFSQDVEPGDHVIDVRAGRFAALDCGARVIRPTYRRPAQYAASLQRQFRVLNHRRKRPSEGWQRIGESNTCHGDRHRAGAQMPFINALIRIAAFTALPVEALDRTSLTAKREIGEARAGRPRPDMA